MSTGYLVPLRAGGVPLHLRAGETVIGRNELRTARKLVSKLHLRLDLSGSAALLTDTSINGTYVNGARLAREEPREVSSGNVVTLLTADSTDFAFVFVRCGGGSHASTDEAVIAPLLELIRTLAVEKRGGGGGVAERGGGEEGGGSADQCAASGAPPAAAPPAALPAAAADDALPSPSPPPRACRNRQQTIAAPLMSAAAQAALAEPPRVAGPADAPARAPPRVFKRPSLTAEAANKAEAAAAAAAASAERAAAAASQAAWFFVDSSRSKRGPVSESDLRELIGAGDLGGSSLVWKKGMKEWTEARHLPELAAAPAAAAATESGGELGGRAEEGAPAARPAGRCGVGGGGEHGGGAFEADDSAQSSESDSPRRVEPPYRQPAAYREPASVARNAADKAADKAKSVRF